MPGSNTIQPQMFACLLTLLGLGISAPPTQLRKASQEPYQPVQIFIPGVVANSWFVSGLSY